MLETLLTQFGYPILFIGTFLEGETIMVLAGVAAKLGYLSLDWVILCGLGGTLFGDQLYFFLGRRYGSKLLARHPDWQPRIERVMQKFKRHQNLLILGFRFLYGLRSVTPFAIGMSGISYLRFALLNAIGAAIWAIAIGCAGYYFGHAVEAILGNIKHFEIELMLAVTGFGLFLWLVNQYRRRRKGRARRHKI